MAENLEAATSLGSRESTASRLGLPAAGLLLLLLAWWYSTRGGIDTGAMAPRFAPGLAFESLGQLIASPELARHVLVSLRRIGIGLGTALMLGVPLGLFSWWAPSAEWRGRPPLRFSSCA